MVSFMDRKTCFVSFCVTFVYFYIHGNPTHLAFESLAIKTPPRYSPVEIFTTYFPQCHIPPNSSWVTWLRSYGQYVPTTEPARYDHFCPVMKARYNCAWPTNTTDIPRAFDYHFVWKHPQYPQVCNLRQLVQFIGGPAGIPGKKIFLQGNSYLRQVWEALVCGFGQQITNLTLYENGPSMSLEGSAKRGGQKISSEQLGNFMPDAVTIDGCHGSGLEWRLDDYYRQNVTIPPNHDKCNDDIASVEFGNVQFAYIFRKEWYQIDALVDSYRKIGMPNELDVVVLNSKSRNSTARSLIDFSKLLSMLIEVQKRSLGTYFGADNPWITDPPDGHPCMPGIPDDEANILLFLLLLKEYQKELY